MKLKNVFAPSLALFLAALLLSPVIAAQKSSEDEDKEKVTNLPAIVWADPGNISTLDLFNGAGGEANAPNPRGTFTFIEEDMSGTSAKFNIRDENGQEWKVKMGEEPQAETSATRFLWAAGYFVDEDYYLAEFKVQGLPKLKRGDKYVSEDGTVHGARLERHVKGVKKLGFWDWFENKCSPQKEMNGLRVMMSLVNNWDLKTINNNVEEIGGQRRCVITDVGASLGKTGNNITRSKSVEKDFAKSDFIEKITPEYVDFVMHSRPFFLAAVNIPNEIKRSKMEEITKHIPIEDARWLGKRLSLLSEAQIRDGFRAGGYTQEEVNGYTQAMQKRIAELNAL